MEIKRRFLVGEEWLYLKLYSGPGVLEEILLRDIYPLIEELHRSSVISHFYFVRYSDPAYHLRLRLKFPNPNNSIFVLNTISEKLRSICHHRYLAKFVVDTYNREVERYEFPGIEHAESVFSYNSRDILTLLQNIENDYQKRWLGGIKIMDKYLSMFKQSLKDKYELYQQTYLNLLTEFFSDTAKEELKRLYRKELGDINKVMTDDLVLSFPVTQLYTESKLSAISVINNMNEIDPNPEAFKKFLMDIMHMHYNRLFKIKQRAHEFTIAYMMSNFYKSKIIIDSKK